MGRALGRDPEPLATSGTTTNGEAAMNRISRRSGRGAAERAGAAPMVEALERRLALSASVVDGVLVVDGSTGSDVMIFSAGDGNGVVVARGVPGVPDGTPFAGVTRVRVEARNGNDNISVLGGPRDTSGGLLRFSIFGGNGNDTIQGGPGDDDVRGGNGADEVLGGEGADRALGGKGVDFINGQSGNDTIEGNNGEDTLLGGPGDDTLRGGGGDDAIRGGSGADFARGGYGEDDIFGGLGTDSLFGDRGRDILRGVLSELDDFNPEDANNFDSLQSNPERGTLSDFFWSELDSMVGEGDMTRDMVKATTALQLLRARSADEGDNFDDKFDDLSSGTRRDVRDCTEDAIDEYLDDMYDNPDDINEASMSAIRTATQGCFPSRVQDEYYDYLDSLIELDDELDDFGDALDDIENDGDKDPWFREFEEFFVF